MLQKAERDGPEASTKTEKKKDPFPDLPIPEIPQIDRRSEFRNPVWLPQLTHGYTADMRRTNYQWSWHQADQAPNQTPPELVFSLDLSGFFSAPKEIPKEASDPPGQICLPTKLKDLPSKKNNTSRWLLEQKQPLLLHFFCPQG